MNKKLTLCMASLFFKIINLLFFLFAGKFCFAQTGADVITAWTGTIDQTTMQITNLPSNGKVVQLSSSTIVSAGASFKIVDGMGTEVGRQTDLATGYIMIVTSGDGATVKTYSLQLNGMPIASTTVNNANNTVNNIVSQVLQISGSSQYHLTNATNPLQGSLLYMNGEDVWIYFDNIKPSVVNKKFLDHIFVNGQKCMADTTVRVVQWLRGAVVISQSASYQPLEIFNAENLSGSSLKLSLYEYNRATTLGPLHNATASFLLKKGYMATFAENENGTGKSQVFIASDSDIVLNKMPLHLQNNISFIRVLPWRWVYKKGWTSGYTLADTLNAAWNYNWNNNENSTLDEEYIPVRQTQWWPGMGGTNTKKNTTAMLSFNEPNSTSQANMSPDLAIANWPYLMESGLRVGAPAITDGGYSWMSSFIDKADSAGYRVDFIGVHFYRGCQTATQFYSFLKSIYDKCHRPIWITEWNNGANWTTNAGCPQPTYAQQATAIASFVNMLDTTSFVERYSLYEWVETNRQMFTSTNPIVLNPAGVVYRDKASPMANIPMKYISSKAVQVTTATTQSGLAAPILRLEVNTEGTSSPLSALRFAFTTNGTTDPANITNAKLYYTGTSSSFATTYLVGQYDHPNGAFEIATIGNKILAQGTNYFWLTYDVECSSPTVNVLDAEFTSFSSSILTGYMPAVTSPVGSVAINLATSFSTIKNGDWADASTWACGNIPSSTQTVNINNAVSISTPVTIGNVTISAGNTLVVKASGILTLGASSMGAAVGNSNKTLSVAGTLQVDSGIVNINGGLSIRTTGRMVMPAGIVNIDGNDGTAAGSLANEPPFYILSSNLNITGGAINLLDPAYSSSGSNPLSTRVLSYENAADAIIGPGCTITFGGGDDVNPTHTRGFYITTGAGTTGSLKLGNVIMAGGRGLRSMITNGNTGFIVKMQHLTINAGAEIIVQGGPLVITGNLINNGFITTTNNLQGQWLVLAGDSKYGSPVATTINYLPSDSAQTISGTGFFKHTVAAADPTAQSGNYLSGITIYHKPSSPGVNLQMPLTVGALRMMAGKINTSFTSPLTLGNGTSLPGNPNVLTATAGTLYNFINVGQATGTSPTLSSNYSGGWVNGPFSRYAPATITTGQQGIMPVGSDDTARPAQISFTTAPTVGGYLTGQWLNGAPGNNGLPLVEAALTPSTINSIANGYWKVAADASLTGGTYKAAFTNMAAQGIVDYTRTTILKRNNAASNWSLEGTHVAATGSNASLTLSRDNLTGFSEFAIGISSAGALPIRFQYLRGTKVATGNLLTWKVSTNSATVTIELEKSSDGRLFKTTTTIKASRANTEQPFTYTDAQALALINYYRLKMIDDNGAVSYSPIVAINHAVKGFEVIGLYPTLIQNTAYLSLSIGKEGTVKMVISDMAGRKIQSNLLSVTAGGNLLSVDVSRLVAGGYVMSIYDVDGKESRSIKFVVAR